MPWNFCLASYAAVHPIRWGWSTIVECSDDAELKGGEDSVRSGSKWCRHCRRGKKGRGSWEQRWGEKRGHCLARSQGHPLTPSARHLWMKSPPLLPPHPPSQATRSYARCTCASRSLRACCTCGYLTQPVRVKARLRLQLGYPCTRNCNWLRKWLSFVRNLLFSMEMRAFSEYVSQE